MVVVVVIVSSSGGVCSIGGSGVGGVGVDNVCGGWWERMKESDQ